MVVCGMTSLVTGPSGDSGALPNQAINGCQTSTPAPLVILLLCIPLSPLPSPPHSYSCWEHRPRLFPTSPARHHGESVFHPSPVLRSPFQEQLRSSIPHWEVIYPGSRIRIPVVSCILHPQFLLFSIISSSFFFSSHLPLRKTSGKSSLSQPVEDRLWLRSVLCCAPLLPLGEGTPSTPLSLPSPLFHLILPLKAAADSLPSRA